MECCVMPGWNRPEFFKLWTECVLKCDATDDVLFIFCLDHNYSKEYDDIIDAFPLNCAVIRMPLSKYKTGKQSHNVMNGLMVAAKNSDSLVYYVEEDVFIGRDFFRYQREVYRQQPDIFCSIGTKCANSPWRMDGMPGHYFISDRFDYQALGVCFKREVIEHKIAPHFNTAYFQDPTGYCLHQFPKSMLGGQWTEQDGLIRRILENDRGRVAFPHLPRGYHAGFYGYNRMQERFRRQSYQHKLDFIRGVVFDKEKMREHCLSEEYYQDSVPVELDTDFTDLRLVPAELMTTDQKFIGSIY